jgi:hypothetical protein
LGGICSVADGVVGASARSIGGVVVSRQVDRYSHIALPPQGVGCAQLWWCGLVGVSRRGRIVAGGGCQGSRVVVSLKQRRRRVVVQDGGEIEGIVGRGSPPALNTWGRHGLPVW